MRQGQQNRRGRGRSNNSNPNNNSHNGGGNNGNNGRKPQNPLSRIYESNGPEQKIKGTAAQIAEKYLAWARDKQASGDPILAENYFQHAEHYNRIIMAAQAQAMVNQPLPQPQQFQHGGEQHGNGMNGQHRPRNDTPYVMRDQPQPVIDQPTVLAPGLEPQPEIVEVAETPVENSAATEPASSSAPQQPSAPRETDGRRRRRRYPAGGASRASGSAEPENAHNGSGNGLDPASESRPPDEILAN